jgi:hypothetical protein
MRVASCRAGEPRPFDVAPLSSKRRCRGEVCVSGTYPIAHPGSATAGLRVPGAASGVNPRLPRRATRNGRRCARVLMGLCATARSQREGPQWRGRIRRRSRRKRVPARRRARAASARVTAAHRVRRHCARRVLSAALREATKGDAPRLVTAGRQGRTRRSQPISRVLLRCTSEEARYDRHSSGRHVAVTL